MERPETHDDRADEDRPDFWFALKVGLGALAIHYVLGSIVSIAFLAGWLWGTRKEET